MCMLGLQGAASGAVSGIRPPLGLTTPTNSDTNLYQTLCQGALPITWNGVSFSFEEMNDTNCIVHTVILPSTGGADSTITMTVRVRLNSTAVYHDTLRQNDLSTYTPPLSVSISYSPSDTDPSLVALVDTTVTLTNTAGCDSTVVFSLHIWRNYAVEDSAFVCDNKLPHRWREHILLGDTTLVDTLLTLHGADSVVTYTVSTLPSFVSYDTVSFCPLDSIIYLGHDYGALGDYDTLFFAANGCDSLLHIHLQASSTHISPLVSLDGNKWLPYDTLLLGCSPQQFFLRDTTPVQSHEWHFWNNDGSSDTTGTDNLFAVIADTLSTFGFQLTSVSPEGCPDTIRVDTILITFPKPTADFIFYPERPSMHHPFSQFTNRNFPDTCDWFWLVSKDQGGGTMDTLRERNPYYEWDVPATPGDYPVKLVAMWLHYGPDSLTVVCSDTSTQTVVIVNTYLQFPNVVTPNGDGNNDTWEVVNLVDMGEYTMNELWIYNAWGVLVFHAKDIRNHEDFWNPLDTRSPDGTYYFRFSAKNEHGVVRKNGVIEVVR